MCFDFKEKVLFFSSFLKMCSIKFCLRFLRHLLVTDFDRQVTHAHLYMDSYNYLFAKKQRFIRKGGKRNSKPELLSCLLTTMTSMSLFHVLKYTEKLQVLVGGMKTLSVFVQSWPLNDSHWKWACKFSLVLVSLFKKTPSNFDLLSKVLHLEKNVFLKSFEISTDIKSSLIYWIVFSINKSQCCIELNISLFKLMRLAVSSLVNCHSCCQQSINW